MTDDIGTEGRANGPKHRGPCSGAADDPRPQDLTGHHQGSRLTLRKISKSGLVIARQQFRFLRHGQPLSDSEFDRWCANASKPRAISSKAELCETLR